MSNTVTLVQDSRRVNNAMLLLGIVPYLFSFISRFCHLRTLAYHATLKLHIVQTKLYDKEPSYMIKHYLKGLITRTEQNCFLSYL